MGRNRYLIGINGAETPESTGKQALTAAHNPEVGGFKSLSRNHKTTVFHLKCGGFLTFHIALQFRKTCFDPILTPIGAAAHRFNSIIWSGFSLFQRDQQTDDISRLVHQVFQYIQFRLIMVLRIAVHEITVYLQQRFKI